MFSKSIQCPHCATKVVLVRGPKWTVELSVDEDGTGGSDLWVAQCPACERLVIDRTWWQNPSPELEERAQVVRDERLHPPKDGEVAPEVPQPIRRDFDEAKAVASLSPKAAAALARRCLQAALRSCGFQKKRLEQEIEAAEADPRATAQLIQSLQAVRIVGNYASHPNLDRVGEIIDVEPAELEALFLALEQFFDAFFVKPARQQHRIAELERKLREAGKNDLADKLTGRPQVAAAASGPLRDSVT